MATMDCKACLNKSNRAKLGAIALAATFTLLNLSFSGDHDGVADFGIELLRRRQLPSPRPSALADDDPEDYKELIVPKWLTAAVEYGQGEAPEQVEARLKAAMVVAVSESLRSNGSPPPELSQYTLEDLVAISQLYERDFGVVIYDPENDDFLLLYNRRATWVGDIPRLVYTFQLFVIMLRHDYPGRFRGRESEELGELACSIFMYLWLIWGSTRDMLTSMLPCLLFSSLTISNSNRHRQRRLSSHPP
jgi:hypothetical protein